MSIPKALVSGFAGASVLTLMHQILKNNLKDAPEMDILGMKSLVKVLEKSGIKIPQEDQLYQLTLAGDLFFNSLYYALTGSGKRNLSKGLALGLSAGLGAVLLPGPLGLSKEHSSRTANTILLTILIYLAGGTAAAAVYTTLKNKSH